MGNVLTQPRLRLPPPTIHEKSVLFVDMLGFGSLTLEHAIDQRLIEQLRRPYDWEPEERTTSPNPLVEKFVNFHQVLREVIDDTQLTHQMTAVSFSDSAFLVTWNISDAMTCAVRLFKKMIAHGVPVRAGLAVGHFERLRLRFDISGADEHHSAQFFGTGVVKAHRAEQCGVKGIRIILHPSAVDAFNRRQNPNREFPDILRVIPLGKEDLDDQKGNAIASWELNYWDFCDVPKLELADYAAEDVAFKTLLAMRSEAPAATSIQKHYERTMAAIDRMRIDRCQRGEAS